MLRLPIFAHFLLRITVRKHFVGFLFVFYFDVLSLAEEKEERLERLEFFVIKSCDPMLSLRNNIYTIVTRPPRSGCSTLSCKD